MAAALTIGRKRTYDHLAPSNSLEYKEVLLAQCDEKRETWIWNHLSGRGGRCRPTEVPTLRIVLLNKMKGRLMQETNDSMPTELQKRKMLCGKRSFKQAHIHQSNETLDVESKAEFTPVVEMVVCDKANEDNSTNCVEGSPLEQASTSTEVVDFMCTLETCCPSSLDSIIDDTLSSAGDFDLQDLPEIEMLLAGLEEQSSTESYLCQDTSSSRMELDNLQSLLDDLQILSNT